MASEYSGNSAIIAMTVAIVIVNRFICLPPRSIASAGPLTHRSHPAGDSYGIRHAKHGWLARRLFAARTNPENEKLYDNLAKIRRVVRAGSLRPMSNP
jgi:hypothetical protein